jgi:hypothetical protein
MTHGYVGGALVLYVEQMRIVQDAGFAENLGVERQQSLVAQLHDSDGRYEFRRRGYAVDVAHLRLAFALLVGPAEALAIDQTLVFHDGKRRPADIVARHPVAYVAFHLGGGWQVRHRVAEGIVQAISYFAFGQREPAVAARAQREERTESDDGDAEQ